MVTVVVHAAAAALPLVPPSPALLGHCFSLTPFAAILSSPRVQVETAKMPEESNTRPGESHWIGAHTNSALCNMNKRTLHRTVPLLVPLLDALPPAATVCDVGRAGGSITLDIVARYPNLNVLGVDLSAASVRSAQADAEAGGINNIVFAEGDALDLSKTAS